MDIIYCKTLNPNQLNWLLLYCNKRVEFECRLLHSRVVFFIVMEIFFDVQLWAKPVWVKTPKFLPVPSTQCERKIRNLQYLGRRRVSSSFPVNAVSENSENPSQEMKRSNLTAQWVWAFRLKRVLSALVFYGVTTMSAWLNICRVIRQRVWGPLIFAFKFWVCIGASYGAQNGKMRNRSSVYHIYLHVVCHIWR